MSDTNQREPEVREPSWADVIGADHDRAPTLSEQSIQSVLSAHLASHTDRLDSQTAITLNRIRRVVFMVIFAQVGFVTAIYAVYQLWQ